MRTNDQWFEPGDKVMRIGGTPQHLENNPTVDTGDSPKMGEVYCVEDFFEGPQFNAVMLVGFGGWRYKNGMRVGWPAAAFRKVEEIKLCVEAAKHVKTRGKQGVEA